MCGGGERVAVRAGGVADVFGGGRRAAEVRVVVVVMALDGGRDGAGWEKAPRRSNESSSTEACTVEELVVGPAEAGVESKILKSSSSAAVDGLGVGLELGAEGTGMSKPRSNGSEVAAAVGLVVDDDDDDVSKSRSQSSAGAGEVTRADTVTFAEF